MNPDECSTKLYGIFLYRTAENPAVDLLMTGSMITLAEAKELLIDRYGDRFISVTPGTD